MTDHSSVDEIERYADGEMAGEETVAIGQHITECLPCAIAVVAQFQMKSAIRSAMPRYAPSNASRRRIATECRGERASPRSVAPRATRWLGAAAAIALAIIGTGLLVRGRAGSAVRELADLHTTILAGSNPVDVVSDDRHTVKPWFEGRVPFAVPVPDLASTPFRLIGGRVVYWRGRAGAYVLVAKDAHRISIFIFAADAPVAAAFEGGFTMTCWQANGLQYVAVGAVSHEDVAGLRGAFVSAQ